MGTSELGASLIAGNSELFNGPLGNVLLGFNGYMLGKTTEDTQQKTEKDLKDIIYSQDGTKAADHVTTGSLKMVTGAFAKISTALLVQLMEGFTSLATPGSGDDSGTWGRFQYASHRDNRAGVLRIYATDTNGFALLEDEDISNFYEAVPIVDENDVNWGADTQRNLPVTFMVYFHEFGVDKVSGGPDGAFGYFGDPVQEKVPATAWPDVAAPTISIADASDATTIDLTFNENIAKQAPDKPEGIVAKVDDEYIIATAIAAPSGATVAVTFPAASFASGQVIELSISADVFEDTESTPNAFIGINDYPVTNSVP